MITPIPEETIRTNSSAQVSIELPDQYSDQATNQVIIDSPRDQVSMISKRKFNNYNKN